jgi:hypothetical protein
MEAQRPWWETPAPMVGVQAFIAGFSMTDRQQDQIDAQGDAVNLLHDFASRLAREFGVTDGSVRAQLAIINRAARDCMAAQRAR